MIACFVGPAAELLPGLRADAVVLTSGASPESLPLEGKRAAGASRHYRAEVASARGVLRYCVTPTSVTGRWDCPGSQKPSPRSSCLLEKDVRDLLQLKQRSEAGGFITTEKLR